MTGKSLHTCELVDICTGSILLYYVTSKATHALLVAIRKFLDCVIGKYASLPSLLSPYSLTQHAALVLTYFNHYRLDLEILEVYA